MSPVLLAPIAGLFVEHRPRVSAAPLRPGLRVAVVDTIGVPGFRRALSAAGGDIVWLPLDLDDFVAGAAGRDQAFLVAGPGCDFDYLRLVADECDARIVALGLPGDERIDLALPALAGGLRGRRTSGSVLVGALTRAARESGSGE